MTVQRIEAFNIIININVRLGEMLLKLAPTQFITRISLKICGNQITG